MLRVGDLLNPEASEGLLDGPQHHPFPRVSHVHEEAMVLNDPRSGPPTIFPRNDRIPGRSSPRGTVKFFPHEVLDQATLRELARYGIDVASIRENPRHIPYNSEKKDFFDKTGRESFEVFEYHFSKPGETAVYHVMWDYNNGLVRLTPFFKCCGYSKTTPGKMLNSNPGLKEISHSITGGSICAQGYWIPFACARAICATFCYHIAPVFIPMFGPSFPAECTPPESQAFGRMQISPSVIAAATSEAVHFRRLFMSHHTASLLPTPSPHDEHRVLHRQDRPIMQPRSRLQGISYPSGHRIPHHVSGVHSPYGSDTDGEGDGSPRPVQYHNFPPQMNHWEPDLREHGPSRPHPGWVAANHHIRPAPMNVGYAEERHPTSSYGAANPFLSAVPHSVPPEQPSTLQTSHSRHRSDSIVYLAHVGSQPVRPALPLRAPESVCMMPSISLPARTTQARAVPVHGMLPPPWELSPPDSQCRKRSIEQCGPDPHDNPRFRAWHEASSGGHTEIPPLRLPYRQVDTDVVDPRITRQSEPHQSNVVSPSPGERKVEAEQNAALLLLNLSGKTPPSSRATPVFRISGEQMQNDIDQKQASSSTEAAEKAAAHFSVAPKSPREERQAKRDERRRATSM